MSVVLLYLPILTITALHAVVITERHWITDNTRRNMTVGTTGRGPHLGSPTTPQDNTVHPSQRNLSIATFAPSPLPGTVTHPSSLGTAMTPDAGTTAVGIVSRIGGLVLALRA